MATWTKDPLCALEDLADLQQRDSLAAKPPIIGRPTLRLHFGLLLETQLGLYGTPGRKQKEEDLLRLFLRQHGQHVAAVAPLRPGIEGTSHSRWDVMFHNSPSAIQDRQ